MASICLFVPVVAAPLAHAQNVEFELHLNGKPVGVDIYSLSKTKKGYQLSSHLKGRIGSNDLDYRDVISVNDEYGYLEGSSTSQDTNSMVSFLPSKDHKEMTVAVAVGGRTSSTIEALTPTDPMVLLPPFDAGAAQVLLLQATAHPAPKQFFSVYLTPGYSLGGGGRRGAGPAPGADAAAPEDSLPPNIHCFQALWIQGGPLTGTLDGKPVDIKTYELAFGRFRWLFFADQSNNLMQVNVSLLHGSYIRNGFKLDPPKPTVVR